MLGDNIRGEEPPFPFFYKDANGDPSGDIVPYGALVDPQAGAATTEIWVDVVPGEVFLFPVVSVFLEPSFKPDCCNGVFRQLFFVKPSLVCVQKSEVASDESCRWLARGVLDHVILGLTPLAEFFSTRSIVRTDTYPIVHGRCFAVRRRDCSLALEVMAHAV